MQEWLSFKILMGFIFLSPGFMAQSWKPDMIGNFHRVQYGISGEAFEVEFKPNGPMGKDWLYGGYWDQDSIRRCVAYREGGRWNHLPFSGYFANVATDIEMYGDTLYIAGDFSDIVIDKDSSTLPNSGLLKWWNDSLWTTSYTISGPLDLTVHGDSLLIWGSSYYNPPKIIYTHFMTTDGGATWQYPYSIVHPTSNSALFGARAKLEILANGDILTLNGGSAPGNPYGGIARWDGQQWHSYGNGLYGGGFVHTLDFEFYKGELYMGGTFAKYNTYYGDTLSHFPQNPGNAIVRWDGRQWQELAGGILEGGVRDIFVHDSILYCSTFAGVPSFHRFGDAAIPFFAGWDGHKWCGTPFNFDDAPASFGIIKDTLYVSFNRPTVVSGDTVSYLNYYDGDYLHGPNAICSTLGLGEEENQVEAQRISIYPNPANGFVNISLPKETTNAQLSLYSLSGQLVFELPLTKTQNQLKLPKGISGLYLVVVESAGQVFTEKILVESE